MDSWLVRSPMRLFEQIDAATMEQHFKVPFVNMISHKSMSNEIAIANPDLSAVRSFLQKYWIVQPFPDDTVTLMDQAARDQLDSQQEKVEAKRDEGQRKLLGFMDLMVDEINMLRQALGITPARTLSDYKQQTNNRIDRQ